MNVKVLSYILSVNKFRNFHLAAEQCGVSQPALSAAIKSFERSLGVEVFLRTTRKVCLTPVGEKIIAQLQVIHGEIVALKELTNYHNESCEMPLRIAVENSISNILMVNVMQSLKARLPKLQLQVFEESYLSSINKLMNNAIDLAIMPKQQTLVAGLIDEQVLTEPLLLCAPINHKVLKQPTKQNILQETLILPKMTDSFLVEIKSFLGSELTKVPSFAAVSMQAMFAMISAGMGVGFMPASFTVQAANMGLDYRSVQGRVERIIYLIWRANEERTNSIGHIKRIIANKSFVLI